MTAQARDRLRGQQGKVGGSSRKETGIALGREGLSLGGDRKVMLTTASEAVGLQTPVTETVPAVWIHGRETL